jgi:hypothetical protein
MSNSNITIRRIDRSADAAALARLAGVDSRVLPAGELLGAEVDDRLLAVMSLEEGTVIGDPFQRTSELRKLLQLRAAQIRETHPRGVLGRRLRLRGDRPRTRRLVTL